MFKSSLNTITHTPQLGDILLNSTKVDMNQLLGIPLQSANKTRFRAEFLLGHDKPS